MRHVIAVGNQKGGVAKTTTALNLAAGLSGFGKKRVLLVDMDPQADATQSLPLDDNAASEASIADLLEGTATFSDVVQEISPSVHLLPSTIALAGLEPRLAGVRDVFRLRDALAASDHDFVIIDCPPSLGNLTTNALAAATHVLIPVPPAAFGLRAVPEFLRTIDTVQRRFNPDLKLLGILITSMDSRTVMARDVAQVLAEDYGEKLLETRIRVNVRLDEAVSARQSIFRFDPRSSGAHDYDQLVKEVLKRVR
jgi:chromosome partitioning protein